MSSSVYIVSDDAGYCKIGASAWGNDRVKEVHTPAGIGRWAVACSQRHDLAYSVESACHRALTHLRFQPLDGKKIRGESEWFRLSVEEAIAIVERHWFEKTGTNCAWQWDTSTWSWKNKFGGRSMRISGPDFATKRQPKR